ncbi:armadillo-type fold protein [Artemisia annua]|uniref:Armadillo-type fold protein n=1 Tax=Artemisia annua TaxID=35608 RepID=A0A2U1KHI7_ARTAN|nr:armadillo-type fold protein [Artemisia annua]
MLRLSDQDSRVCYYACEALYNIAKESMDLHFINQAFFDVVRGVFIFHFNKILDALCKLSADSDPNVQNATHIFDRLVNVGWMTLLDGVPDMDDIPGLLNILNEEILQCHPCFGPHSDPKDE